jgi:hypothetical protein
VGRDYYFKCAHVLVFEDEMMGGFSGDLDFGSSLGGEGES